MDRQKRAILTIVPQRIGQALISGAIMENGAEELRLRKDRPSMVRLGGCEWVLGASGRLSMKKEDGIFITQEEIDALVAAASRYSVYAYCEDIRQGFLTIEGGHRIGLSGRATVEHGKVKTLRQINSCNIRIARAWRGCADRILPFLYEDGRLCHTVILSPPGGGKTTLLRDIIRQVSDGVIERGRTVGVVDERGEISGSGLLDTGLRTDVLEGCPKEEGIRLLLRSMGPEVIAVDELGGAAEYAAVQTACHWGITVVCTIHGKSGADLFSQPLFRRMAAEGTFERVVVLDGAKKEAAVYDGKRKLIYSRREAAIC